MKFQKELAELINESIIDAGIRKKDLAELIETSNVYVTKITNVPGALPSPSKTRKIITALNQNGQDIGARIEAIIEQSAPEGYQTEYYIAKLRECYSEASEFIKYLKREAEAANL